jgi:hypothetical protein
MTPTIQPATHMLTASTFDDFLASAVAATQVADKIVLDLRCVDFIDLFAMIGLIYACAELHEQYACSVRLEFDDVGAGRYFPQIGFLNVLGSDVEVVDVLYPGARRWR